MICDLAEVYGILNYKELSPSLVATLFFGLPDNSRVKMELSGQKLTLEQMLLAIAVDNLNFLCWTKTKDSTRNKGKPESIFKKLMGLDNHGAKKEDLMSFKTPEEFEAHMRKIRGGK